MGRHIAEIPHASWRAEPSNSALPDPALSLTGRWQPTNRTDLSPDLFFTTNLLSDPKSLPLPWHCATYGIWGALPILMSASVYANPWELGQKEKKEGSRLYVVQNLTLGLSPPVGPSRAQEHRLRLSMVWNSGRSGRPASSHWLGWMEELVKHETTQEGLLPRDPHLCALCPGPPDLWCSPDPFQPEEAWQKWSVMNLMLEWREHHRAPGSDARHQSTSHFDSTTSISAMFWSFHFSAPWVPSPKLGHIISLWAGATRGFLRYLLICDSLGLPVCPAREWVKRTINWPIVPRSTWDVEAGPGWAASMSGLSRHFWKTPSQAPM